MKINAKCNGVSSVHSIPSSVMALVHDASIKVESVDAYSIAPEDTLRCMKEMSEDAWRHISTGPVFAYLFNLLFEEQVKIPVSVKSLVEDYSDGVVHGAGLIVLLVEAVFDGKKEIFLKYPETYLHPAQTRHLVQMVKLIQRLSALSSQGGSHEHS